MVLSRIALVSLCLTFAGSQQIRLGPSAGELSACQADEATCSNGFCIAKSQVCDQTVDCPDGSDESQCHESHQCQPNELACVGNSSRCVLKDWRCDGDDDCGDGSDEENCMPATPESECSSVEFQCEQGSDYGAQCIPRSFHCDGQPDCQDYSDEVGCAAPIFVTAMPATVRVGHGDVFVLNCRAVGIPTPHLVWRRNWGHVPNKCTQKSLNGDGELTCPDAQRSDQGAYSCEAMNIKGSRFAVPDTLVIVTGGPGICQRPDFNAGALTNADCQRCFCFGATNDCHSSSLHIHTMPTVDLGEVTLRSVLDLHPELSLDRPIATRSMLLLPSDHVEAAVSVDNFQRGQLYFRLPFSGPLLLSYGGYLRYTLQPGYESVVTGSPDVIIQGGGRTIWYRSDTPLSSPVSLHLIEGTFYRFSSGSEEVLASREDIMMVLLNVEMFLIAVPVSGVGSYHGSLSKVRLDTASREQSRQGPAILVEQCQCPLGYSGLSCEDCAPGYIRVATGQWLGKCVEQTRQCPPEQYGDPSREIPCQPCPCLIMDESYGMACHLGVNDLAVCDCPPGQMGHRCELCSSGYEGDPIAGQPCLPKAACDPAGSLDPDPDPITGMCHCKLNVRGRQCEECKQRAFYLHALNRHGCINCHCMGVTDICTSANWYLDQVGSIFTTSDHGFRLTNGIMGPTVVGVEIDGENRQLVYNIEHQDSHQPLYWSLPARYLGNKVTSYGGELRAMLKHPAAPDNALSTAQYHDADVEIYGDGVRLVHRLFVESSSSADGAGPVERMVQVPFYEHHWRNEDGQLVDRGQLLAVLAQLQYLFIRAAHSTSPGYISLSNVSMDVAVSHNTGQPRASAVEQCTCPPGYQGLSCERCVSGYRRVANSMHRHRCELCSCNGFSEQCDPETGHCQNCGGNTAGVDCGRCAPGYIGDPTRGESCVPDPSTGCQCDPRGSRSGGCDNRQQCDCKTGVEGSSCNVCRPGYFSLSAGHEDGCLRCFCSDISQQCTEDRRRRSHIPMQLTGETHGFTLTNSIRNLVISGDRFSLNIAENEIGYNQFSQDSVDQSSADPLYWSLPEEFLGNQLSSYGGTLMVRQRFDQRQSAPLLHDYDVIISGGDVTLAWSNPTILQANRMNSYEIEMSESADWQFVDPGRSIRRRASRRDLMSVLTQVNAVLIRAVFSSGMRATYLSNVVLETSTPMDNGQELVGNIEKCLCPREYTGLSCEQCATGHYRVGSSPSSPCRLCPCNGNEEQCLLSGDQVICRCKIGYSGLNCQNDEESTIRVFVAKPLLVVRSGEVATLSCTGESRTGEQVMIRWSKQDGRLPSKRAIDDGRGTLVIRTVGADDSGVYVCEVRDSFSIRTSQTVLKVEDKTDSRSRPSAEIFPETVEVDEGEPVRLECSGQWSDPAQITWSSRSGPLHSDITTSGSHFMIESARKEHEGKYQCTVTNWAGSDSASAILYVNARATTTAAPQLFVQPVHPEHSVLEHGQRLTLQCTPKDQFHHAVWSKIDSELPQNAYQTGGVLQIDSIAEDGAGIYQCTIISPSGQRKEYTATVEVVARPREQLRPTASIQPGFQSVPQGSSASLECVVTGEPYPHVTWTRTLGPMPSRVVIEGRRLVISNIQPEDRDHYMCEATNSRGRARSYSVVDVEVREPPLVEVFPSGEVITSRGTSIFLQCRARAGIPAPSIRWSRVDGSPLSSYSTQSPHDGVLKLYNITSQDAGVYECVVSNIVGQDRRRVTVLMQSEPTVYFNVPSPHRVHRGDRTVLECIASGDPAPAVHWLRRDGKALSGEVDTRQTSSREGTVKSRLVLPRALTMDSGVYVCRARNTAGIAERPLRLHVLPTGRESDPVFPAQPVNQRHTVPRDGNAELRCYFPHLGRGETTVRWARSDGRDLPSDHLVRSGILYLYDVQKEAEGSYTCTATSTDGQVSSSVETFLSVLEPPVITMHPQHQVVQPGDNVFIHCSATGSPPIDIRWRKEGARSRGGYSAVANGGKLNFRHISVRDAGWYVCTATNQVAQAEKRAQVVVRRGPSVEAVQKNITAPVGSAVLMQCRVQGTSERARWHREDRELPTSATVGYNTLSIPSAIESDSGRYWCTVRDSYGVTARDSVVLTINHPGGVRLTIRSSAEPIRAGMTVDISCQASGDRYSQVTWLRPQRPLSDNTVVRGGTMRVFDVRSDNGGVYVCRAETSDGTILQHHYVLTLAASEDEAQDLPEYHPRAEIRRVKRGHGITLPCEILPQRDGLYRWTKDNTEILANNARELAINDAKVADSGVYKCHVDRETNPRVDGVTPPPILIWFLLVEDSVPAFDGSPASFLQLPTLPNSRHRLDLEISFRPNATDGIILYNGGKAGDFVAFGLDSNYPTVRFSTDTGHVTEVRSKRRVTPGQWHTARLQRLRGKGKLILDDEEVGRSDDSSDSQELDLDQPLFLAGVPDIRQINRLSGFSSGYRGCISRLVAPGIVYDLTDTTQSISRVQETPAVGECDVCGDEPRSRPCKNGGECQAEANPVGHRCVCRSGFSGNSCEIAGDVCSDSCGDFECLRTGRGAECLCPLGRAGDRCQLKVNVTLPRFDGASWMSFGTPRTVKRLEFEITFRPESVDEGMLMYLAESPQGLGDFVAITLSNGFLELNFNHNGELVKLRGPIRLRGRHWYNVKITRDVHSASLQINNGELVESRTPSHRDNLSLQTPLYIGAPDFLNVTVNPLIADWSSGYRGCVSSLLIGGTSISLLQSHLTSYNIDQCLESGAACQPMPCQHGAACSVIGANAGDYRCACEEGHHGINCSESLDACTLDNPCLNGATCQSRQNVKHCACPPEFMGDQCETSRNSIETGVFFNGRSYLQFAAWDLPEGEDVLRWQMTFSTRDDGLLLFTSAERGGPPSLRSDHFALAVRRGRLEMSITSPDQSTRTLVPLKVDGGERHVLQIQVNSSHIALRVFRRERSGSGSANAEVTAPFLPQHKGPQLTFLGGIPRPENSMNGQYASGLVGCIRDLIFQDVPMPIGTSALSGANISPCLTNDLNDTISEDSSADPVISPEDNLSLSQFDDEEDYDRKLQHILVPDYNDTRSFEDQSSLDPDDGVSGRFGIVPGPQKNSSSNSNATDSLLGFFKQLGLIDELEKTPEDLSSEQSAHDTSQQSSNDNQRHDRLSTSEDREHSKHQETPLNPAQQQDFSEYEEYDDIYYDDSESNPSDGA